MSESAVLRRGGLSSQLATHLTDQIVAGTLAPAQALPTERELAQRFAVSVGVVREAIKSVAAMGLIEVRHGVGSFVNPRERWDTATPLLLLLRSDTSSVMDVYDVRAPLELLSAEWAAQRATGADVAALDAAIEHMRRSVDLAAPFAAADTAFHVALAAAAHNSILLAVLQPLIEPIRDCMLRIVELPVAAPRAIEEHTEIVAAVRARKVARARTAMRRHLLTTRDELTAISATAPRSRAHGAEGTP